MKSTEEENTNKLKIKNMDFDENFINQNLENDDGLNEFNNYDGDYFENEEFEEEGYEQIDEENDTKMITEDLLYLNDISTKIELQVHIFKI